MNIGIVGCGRIADAHVNALSLIESVNEIVLFDVNKDTMSNLAKKISKNSVMTNSLSELAYLSDAYIICTPNNTHLQVIHEISKYRYIPCVCEKPLANNLDSAEKIINMVHPLSIISFNCRYNYFVKMIRTCVDKLPLGNLNYFSATYNKNSAFVRPNITWRDTMEQRSGAIIDSSVHIFDLFCLLANQYIDIASLRVSKGTRVKNKHGGAVEVDDNGYVVGHGSEGCIFTVKSSKAEQEDKLGFYLRLIYEHGEINYSTENPYQIKTDIFNNIQSELIDIHRNKLIPDPERELPYWSDSFYWMLQEWCQSIEQKKRLMGLPYLEAGIHIQRVIEEF